MNLVAVGNMTVDEIYTGSKHFATAPGGASFFVANTANLLGARSMIVSSVGPDYPRSIMTWMEMRGIGLDGVVRTRERTTRFLLRYSKRGRKLELLNRGVRVPYMRLRAQSDVVHLGPVYREIDLRTVSHARKHSRFLALDVQGIVRDVGRRNEVVARRTNVAPLLDQCDLVKAAEAEALILTSAKDPPEMAYHLASSGRGFAIVTLGTKGLVLASKSHCWRVPAFPERSVIDATGAGDAMVGGWLVAFWRTRDPAWASAVGTAISSMIIRHVGLRKFRVSRNELLRRASWVYERIEQT